MLSSQIQEQLVRSVAGLWAERAQTPEFAALAQGREIGHRIAGYVESVTCAHLEERFTTAREYHQNGSVRGRSMGDVWVGDGGLFHPVNIKTGIAGLESTPNIVSLKKVAGALAGRVIDSYWLLLVKVDLSEAGAAKANVDLVNLFDHLDYVCYNSGPGQLMLKARRFFEARAAGRAGTPRSGTDVLDRLYRMCEEADERLISQRALARAALAEQRDSFRPDAPLQQDTLLLRP